MEKLKVYCPYPSLDLGWKTIKKLTNISFDKPWYLEYNTDTSARHSLERRYSPNYMVTYRTIE